MRLAAGMLLWGAALLLATPAAAQDGMRAECESAILERQRDVCVHLADVAATLPARIGLAASGGNAVPGTASTLGMRLGSLPRVSFGLRGTVAGVELPPVEQERDRTFAVFGLAADGSVGLFQGVALLPTVGGFGSIDLLASAAVLPLRGGSGFADGTTFAWAAGARVGILRESFTAPGISVDVLYRGVGDVTWSDPAAPAAQGELELDGNRVTSVRGVIGKRIFGFGANAGAGWDRYRSNATITAHGLDVPLTPAFTTSERGITTSRTSIFGNASFTLLILNLGIEAGWQNGGSVPEGAAATIGRGGLFGGLSARLVI